MDFNIDMVIKTIPEFTGIYKYLEKFLTIVEYLYNGYSASAKSQLIDFTIKVKLSAQVRTAKSSTETPENFQELKAKLLLKCKNTKTLYEIY